MNDACLDCAASPRLDSCPCADSASCTTGANNVATCDCGTSGSFTAGSDGLKTGGGCVAESVDEVVVTVAPTTTKTTTTTTTTTKKHHKKKKETDYTLFILVGLCMFICLLGLI